MVVVAGIAAVWLLTESFCFGLRQVYLPLANKEYEHVEFKTSMLYRFVRHPIMLGFIIAFWATPDMTAGHLLFSIATTVYILIGLQFEEHDLVTFIGEDYEEYRRCVPMLVPCMRKSHKSKTT